VFSYCEKHPKTFPPPKTDQVFNLVVCGSLFGVCGGIDLLDQPVQIIKMLNARHE
jgi:hypothetical protein